MHLMAKDINNFMEKFNLTRKKGPNFKLERSKGPKVQIIFFWSKRDWNGPDFANLDLKSQIWQPSAVQRKDWLMILTEINKVTAV